MEGEKSKGRIAAEWIGIVAALFIIIWMIFGGALKDQIKYMGTELSYATVADHSGARAAVRRHMEESLLWKCYFAHLSAQDESKPLITVSVDLERTLFGPPVNEPNRYNSSGHVAADLTVRERGRREAVYTKSIEYKLPAVFTFSAQATGNGQEDVFLDTERKAVDEIVAYLSVAAMRAMALRPTNAAYYAPIVVKSLGDTQAVVYEAASDTLREFGPAAKSVKPEVEKLLKKRKDARAQRAVKRVLKSMG